MTDQTIPADQVREIVGKMLHHANHDNVRGTEEEYIRFFAGQFAELLPKRPTLADMTPAERRGCQWMQCEVRGERRIITLVSDDDDHNDAVTLAPSGSFFLCSLEIVTPLPDLPRMTWPGDQEDENAVKIGDEIESAADPRVAALPDGSILLDREGEATAKRNHSWRGAGYSPVPSQGAEFGPWTVVHIPKEDDQ